MRMWRGENGAIITDEQLMQYIAYFGSLSAAAENGNVHLLNEDDRQDSGAAVAHACRKEFRSLKDYIES